MRIADDLVLMGSTLAAVVEQVCKELIVMAGKVGLCLNGSPFLQPGI